MSIRFLIQQFRKQKMTTNIQEEMETIDTESTYVLIPREPNANLLYKLGIEISNSPKIAAHAYKTIIDGVGIPFQVVEPVAYMSPTDSKDSNVITATWKEKMSKTESHDGYEKEFAARHSIPLYFGHQQPAPTMSQFTSKADYFDEVIKRLMNDVGMPNSLSLHQAFKRFQNEIHQQSEQNTVKQLADRKLLGRLVQDIFNCDEYDELPPNIKQRVQDFMDRG